MSTTITVSIGRKVGAGPEQLSQGEWQSFAAAVFGACERNTGGIVFDGYGTGRYDPPEGPYTIEDAYTVVCVGPEGPDRFERLATLRKALGWNALRFRQNSVALVIGEVDFVEASP